MKTEPIITNADLPAMPTPDTYHPSGQIEFGNSGLTKREYLAAMAMQGLCANAIPGSHHRPEVLTTDAVRYADALLRELEQ